jgi:Uma2 family endonuclease
MRESEECAATREGTKTMMQTPTNDRFPDTVITVDLAACLHLDDRWELQEGHLVTMNPPGWKHGRTLSRVARLIDAALEGSAYVSLVGDVGIVIDARTVLAPDLAVYAKARLAATDPAKRWATVLPDLVIEVLSPDDDGPARARRWRDAGVPVVWLIDPELRTLAVWDADGLQANVTRVQLPNNVELVVAELLPATI